MQINNSKNMGYRDREFADLCLNNTYFKSYFVQKTYKNSTVILSQGTSIEHFGIVIDGVLKAEKCTQKGSELCCTYFENNDVFPELLYFTGERIYTYSLIAVKKTKVVWIPVNIFEKMLSENIELTASFMFYISKRALKSQLLLNCLNYSTIRQRIACWILSMNDINQSDIISLPGSQTIWANTLHVSRSSLNQELRHMKEKGYFDIKDNNLILLDLEALEMIL